MHGEHSTSEKDHPASQGQGFFEVPLLLSRRRLAALEMAAFRQGVTVAGLLRRLIADYLAEQSKQRLDSETMDSIALAERFDGMPLGDHTEKS
jgi:hypothetical protein